MVGIVLSKVKASSLLETIIAMAVVMMVFGIATTVYMKIAYSSYTAAQMNASMLMNEISLKTVRDKSFFDEKIEMGSVTVYKTVKNYQNLDDLLLIEYEVLDGGQKRLGERKEIIFNE